MFITDSRVIEGSSEYPLAEEASGGLMGWLSPVGVSSPSDDAVAYNSWRWLREVDPAGSFSAQGISPGDGLGVPSIRILELGTDRDTLLVEGAYSIAWRADDTIAWFQGEHAAYRADEPYLGTVFVREPGKDPVAWTDAPGRYIVVGWAGASLIGYLQEEGGSLNVVRFIAPGKAEILAADSDLIAISPDGTRVFVSSNVSGVASVLDVASGATLASLDLATAADPDSGVPVGHLAYGGSWEGNLVAAESTGGLSVFDIAGDHLAVRLVLHLPGRRSLFHEPRFVDEDRVVGWTPGPSDVGSTYLECSLDDSTCRMADGGFPSLASVNDLSRP